MTSVRSDGAKPRVRLSVISSSEGPAFSGGIPPPGGRNCLGFDFLLTGQKRVPKPPAMMTAHKEGALRLATRRIL